MTRTVLTLVLLALFIVPLTAAAPTTNIDVDKIKTEPVPLQTGEYATVWLTVRNNGDTIAEDVSVMFTPTFPFTVDPDEKTAWNFASLTPGEEYQLRLQVKVDENAVHGENDLTFRTQVADGATITRTVPVDIRTDDAALVVEHITFPDAISPGSTHNMHVTVRNLADSHLKNIDVEVDLSSDDLPFAPIDTTQRRVQSLAPGETTEISFGIHTDEGADNGAYKIPLNLDYEDEAGTAHERELLTGLVVGGEPRVTVGINSQELLQAGGTGTVTLRIVNQGDGTARFAEIAIPDSDAYDVLSPRTAYLGNMDPDDYQTAELEIHAAGGSFTLPVTLTYRDAQGDLQELNRQVEITLYSQGELQAFGKTGGGNTLLYTAVVAVLGIGGVLYWRRRKRRSP